MHHQEIYFSLGNIIDQLSALRLSNGFRHVAYDDGGDETAETIAGGADTALLHLRCLRQAVARMGNLSGKEPND